MKITDVSAMILRYEYDESIADAQNYFSARNAVIVTVKTDEGIEGIGEAASFGGPPESTKFIVENELAPLLSEKTPPILSVCGKDVRPHSSTWSRRHHYFRYERYRCGTVGHIGQKPVCRYTSYWEAIPTNYYPTLAPVFLTIQGYQGSRK